jgi:hypothetical protein
VLPDSIADLPEATSEDLLHPVSEAVEEDQPTLYWSAAFGEPPYTVTVTLGSQVVARGQGLQNLTWTLPRPLPRGQVYTWQVRSAGVSAEASFRILDQGQVALWRGIRSDHGSSHLVMGTVAEQLGMLGIAEREYTALVRSYPDSPTAARLLDNVVYLRGR